MWHPSQPPINEDVDRNISRFGTTQALMVRSATFLRRRVTGAIATANTLTLEVCSGVVHGRISDVKTEYSEDLLPLDSAFAEVMLEWQKRCSSSWVFPNPNTGNPYHASPIGQDYIRAAGRKAKLGKISVGTHVPLCL